MSLKSIPVFLLAGLLLCACGPSVQSLYNWGGSSSGVTTYEKLTYRNYDKQTPESICALIAMYERMVQHPGGTRQVPPPGICAEYAWLLAQPGTAETFARHATGKQRSVFSYSDYAAGFPERSRELFEMEVRYYPESIVFIKPLAERLLR